MALPNFLIIGAAKSGTTSLYHYLRQHPEVYMSPVKEPRFFDEEGDAEFQTRASYERLFDGASSHKVIGEASPQYLNSRTAPGRIAADLPGVKLLASLRNPADRAYSSYLGRLRGVRERSSVEEAMQPGTYHFDSSLYYPRLLRYFEQFERKRIKIVLFDDLVSATDTVVRDICHFLEIDESVTFDVSLKHNPGSVPFSVFMYEAFHRTRAVLGGIMPPLRGTGLGLWAQGLLLREADPLSPAIRRRLLEQFSDDVAKTGALIGRDLSHWLA